MTNKDLIFTLVLTFWTFIVVGAITFFILLDLPMSALTGVNVGAGAYLLLLLALEQACPKFKKWLYTKIS